MLERFVLVSSDVENHNLVDTVFILFEKVCISGDLEEVFVEDSFTALEVDQGVLAVNLAIEVKRSAVFVLLGDELRLVEDRFDLVLLLPIEVFVESVLRQLDFERSIIGVVNLFPGNMALNERVNESSDLRCFVDIGGRVDSLETEIVRPLYERRLIKKSGNGGSARNERSVGEVISCMSLRDLFEFISHCCFLLLQLHHGTL